MRRSYSDITSRLGTPLWYDYNGAPRYEEFHPDLCGVYDSYVAYLEVACQSCGKKFLVTSEVDTIDSKKGNFYLPIPPPSDEEERKVKEVVEKLDDDKVSPWHQIGSFHYGDPPSHDDCLTGSTMNAIPMRIVEFWERVSSFDWKRNKKYEFTLSKVEEDV